jgi:lon-related putative ATP-dependent protease
MEKLVEEARNALKAAFENEEYQNRKQGILQEFQENQQGSFQELQNKAKERNLAVLRTPAGFAIAPVRDGEVVPQEEFDKLPEEEQQRVQKEIEELQQETRKIFQSAPRMEREMREKVKALDRDVTNYAIEALIDELRQKHDGVEEVADYLKAVKQDIVENVDYLLPRGEARQQQEQLQQLQKALTGDQTERSLRRYQVNVVVDHTDSRGAPVIHEDLPTYQNLAGRVEHLAQMGALVTDFNMIRAGALLRANGGYLVLDALKVLEQPLAWEGLKRALKSRSVKVESPAQLYSLISTVSLEPDPVPLNLKVVLIGHPVLYYLIRQYDPEFAGLFKVAADFDIQMDRTAENEELYSRFVATVIRREGLRHFDRAAVARVIEHSARMIGDGERLSARMQPITDLLRESDYWAGQNGNGTVRASDVQIAIDGWVYRSDRFRQRLQEEIQRGTILIDTEGEQAGQVNALSVIQLGEFSFGRPNRITARVRVGKGEVVDIEREVEMGGPIHSKGVLILSGFLGARYAAESPLSLSASLVFEQSYGGVEGDSASSAELFALLSAIAQAPVKQPIAVTGSVNQHGSVQPIGGVNEKIEGFFDVCRARGLTGRQGVVIPAQNVKHLMLRRDVVEAVEESRFHVYPIESVDEGIEILTGMPAGATDESGAYPAGTFNDRVQSRLAELAEKQMKYSQVVAAEKRGESHERR